MKIAKWGGAGAALGLAVGALALAAPAQAQDEHFPDAGWQVRQIASGDPDWSAATESAIVDASTVELTKPAGDTGTSIETTNLGLDVAAGDTITVAYELLDGATTDAGAIRLFVYDHADADTLTEAPAAFVPADGSGTLSLSAGFDGQIGTMGLTYDASNDSAGTVRFTDLTVADTSVLFVEPEPEPTTKPSPEPECVDVNTADAETLTLLMHVDAERAQQILELRPFTSVDDLDQVDGLAAGGPRLDELVAGGDGFLPLCEITAGEGGEDDDEGLPVTGMSTGMLAAGGALLLAAGGAAYLVARRRRTSFTA